MDQYVNVDEQLFSWRHGRTAVTKRQLAIGARHLAVSGGRRGS